MNKQGKKMKIQKWVQDLDDNQLEIQIEGVSNQEFEYQRMNEIISKAVKHLISDHCDIKLAVENGEYDTTEKLCALYLNEIGRCLRFAANEVGIDDENISNIDVVKEFLDSCLENQEIVNLINKDNEEHQKMLDYENGYI